MTKYAVQSFVQDDNTYFKMKIYDGPVKSHDDTNVCHSRESGNPFPDRVEDKLRGNDN